MLHSKSSIQVVLGTNIELIKLIPYPAGSKNESIVRIGCHETIQGNLSEYMYYMVNAKSEEQPNYCEIVFSTLENPEQERSVFTHLRNDQIEVGNVETSNKVEESLVEPVNLRQMQQCIMVGSEETGCDGCNVRFYHNGLDRDDIFDPTKDGLVSK